MDARFRDLDSLEVPEAAARLAATARAAFVKRADPGLWESFRALPSAQQGALAGALAGGLGGGALALARGKSKRRALNQALAAAALGGGLGAGGGWFYEGAPAVASDSESARLAEENAWGPWLGRGAKSVLTNAKDVGVWSAGQNPGAAAGLAIGAKRHADITGRRDALARFHHGIDEIVAAAPPGSHEAAMGRDAKERLARGRNSNTAHRWVRGRDAAETAVAKSLENAASADMRAFAAKAKSIGAVSGMPPSRRLSFRGAGRTLAHGGVGALVDAGLNSLLAAPVDSHGWLRDSLSYYGPRVWRALEGGAESLQNTGIGANPAAR